MFWVTEGPSLSTAGNPPQKHADRSSNPILLYDGLRAATAWFNSASSGCDQRLRFASLQKVSFAGDLLQRHDLDS
jgi:hypothetical protein